MSKADSLNSISGDWAISSKGNLQVKARPLKVSEILYDYPKWIINLTFYQLFELYFQFLNQFRNAPYKEIFVIYVPFASLSSPSSTIIIRHYTFRTYSWNIVKFLQNFSPLYWGPSLFSLATLFRVVFAIMDQLMIWTHSNLVGFPFILKITYLDLIN
jgi:hypothetical protein